MTTKRKVMYLNPVGIADTDQMFADMIAANKLPGTEAHVTSLNPADGAFTHIEMRSYEAMVTPGIMRATHAATNEGFDALAIGCFYDTALHDAREVSGQMVVTAPCVAACRLATNLSNRFGIIVGRQKWVHQMHSTVVSHGFGGACSGFYSVGLGANDFQVDHDLTKNRLRDATRRAIEEDHAESIILGCTLEIGFHQQLEAELGVPVIDVSIAAFKEAEFAAEMKTRCGFRPSRTWSCEAPDAAEMAALRVFDDGEVFGNRVIVPAE